MAEQCCVVCGRWLEFDDSISGYVVCWRKKCRKEWTFLRERLIAQQPTLRFTKWILINKGRFEK